MTEIRTHTQFRDLAGRLMQHPANVQAAADARLPRGLMLRCQCRPEGHSRHWDLTLARELTWPTPDEVETCRMVFRVPPSAETRHRRHQRKHPKSGREVQYCVVEMTWVEINEPEAGHEDC